MSGMAGQAYAGTNNNRLETIPLGSGNVYILPVNSTYPTMPSDAQFEQEVNMIGRTKNGATLTYSGNYYSTVSDDGVAKKTKLTSESITFSWGVMTWVAETLEKLLQTVTVTTVDGHSRVTIGGVGNQNGQEYWIHFVGGDPVDGKITVTGRGLNTAGLVAAFANESETVLTPTFEFTPMDSTGALVCIDTAKMTAISDEAPQLTGLSVGALTLTPTFSGSTLEYTVSTTNSTNAVTATLPTGATAVLIVNGSSIANGDSPTWEDGENEVVIRVSDSNGSNTYKVTVDKS